MSDAPCDLTSAAEALLDTVLTGLPGGAEDRPGQRAMLRAVAAAIASGRHLAVEAGTGTGKSLAYLVPAVASGGRVVVATATKALQDQLATKDLPLVAAHVGRPLRFGVLKGRANYVCVQRLAELDRSGEQLALDVVAERAPAEELARVRAWAEQTTTGDQAELDFAPSSATWQAVSVGPRECPGRNRCPSGGACFAEQARDDALTADVTVVNLHLYGLHLATDGAVLGDHDLLVLDEAHQAEDILAAAAGSEIGPGRFGALVRTTGAILADDELLTRVAEAGDAVADELAPRCGQRLTELDPGLVGALDIARTRVEKLAHAVRNLPDDGPLDTGARKLRAAQAAAALIDDLDQVRLLDDARVTWVEGTPANPVLRVTPIDISGMLGERLWGDGPVTVLTSATLPSNLADRLGLDPIPTTTSPPTAPSTTSTRLCCTAPPTCPTRGGRAPRGPARRARVADRRSGRAHPRPVHQPAGDERGGRPSRPPPAVAGPHPGRAAEAGADRRLHRRRGELPVRHDVVLAGRRHPRSRRCRSSTIDRLPFPRPDDPVLAARRDLAGPAAFRTIDLPRACHAAGPGRGAADPLGRRPRRRRRARFPAGPLAQLPLGLRQRPAADAPHPRPRRSRGLPARAARRREPAARPA